MTFEKFVEALYEAGWRAIGDAQHRHIRKLWNELCEAGMTIPSCHLTPAAPDRVIGALFDCSEPEKVINGDRHTQPCQAGELQ